MRNSEKPACPWRALPLGLLAAVWLGAVTHAQQAPTYRGPVQGQQAGPARAPAGQRGFLSTPSFPAAPAVSAEASRMGVLEYRPQQQQQAASDAYIVVVGGVRLGTVIRTRRSEVSLDAALERAGGLAPEATGAILIVRNGQTRMSLFHVPGSGTSVLPGDTILIASRPIARPPSPDAPPPEEPLASIICHGILPRPVIVRIPESVATVRSLMRAFGQDVDAIPPALPPMGVVLPAARPTMSADMPLPTGTTLYFDPAKINRVTLDTLLATRLRFEDAVDLEKATASLSPSAAAPPAPAFAPLSPPAPLPIPFAPEVPAGIPAPLANSAQPPLEFPGATPLPLPASTTSLVPPSEPQRVEIAPQRIEVVRDASAIAASLETVIPQKGEAPSLVPPTELPEAPVEAASGNLSINRDAFTRGLIAGAVIGLLAGLYAWIRSRWTPREPRRTPVSAADLPVTEEPPRVRPQPLHGRVVADRRLAFDPPHESLAGPHFDAAARPKSRPPVVRSAAGARAETATATAQRGGESTETQSKESRATGAKSPGQGGLLDRILVAMQRERAR